MKRNARLLELWENGDRLDIAWLSHAIKPHRSRYLELKRDGDHLGYQQYLEKELVARLEAGELRALGIEHGTDAGPIEIEPYYFSKTAEVDFDRNRLVALGRTFYEVRIVNSSDAKAQARRRRSAAKPTQTKTKEAAAGPPPKSAVRGRGRPSVLPLVRKIVRELREADAFNGKIVKEIQDLVRQEARRRHPTKFPTPARPSVHIIAEALDKEGWPKSSDE